MMGSGETFKKYFQASDVIEMQVSSAVNETRKEFIKVFLALLDLIDFSKAANLILERDYFDKFLQLEKIAQQNGQLLERQKMITALFVQAVRADYESIAIFIATKYESVMQQSAAIVVPAILARLRRNCFLNEMKVYMLQGLQPSFHFRHADELVEVLEEQKRKAFTLDGFVIGNTNPLMVMVILTDILNKIKKQFRSLALRIDFINDDIHSNLV